MLEVKDTCSVPAQKCEPPSVVHTITPHSASPQRARFHGHWQYLFIESICNDVSVLEQNYRYKMMYSPDYAGADSEDVRFSYCPPP